MRNKIARRKSWKIRKKLKVRFPGLYKVCSHFGYGDGSTTGEDLDICSALLLLRKSTVRDDNCDAKPCIGDMFYSASHAEISSTVRNLFDQSNVNFIADQSDEMIWEREDFDPWSV